MSPAPLRQNRVIIHSGVCPGKNNLSVGTFVSSILQRFNHPDATRNINHRTLLLWSTIPEDHSSWPSNDFGWTSSSRLDWQIWCRFHKIKHVVIYIFFVCAIHPTWLEVLPPTRVDEILQWKNRHQAKTRSLTSALWMTSHSQLNSGN
jgi:hypothetical protein